MSSGIKPFYEYQVSTNIDCNGKVQYGLTVFQSADFKKVCSVDDISDDREKVSALADLFSENDLYPIHLIEVLEDML